MNNKDEVALVEFHKRRPFSVIMMDGTVYDVDWCRSEAEYFYHNSGSGPLPESVQDAPGMHYWVHPTANIDVPSDRRFKTTKYSKHPDTWENASESETIGCDICEDRLPVEWSAFRPCDHIRWCDECGDYRTQNEDNYCTHDLEGGE